MKPKRDFTYRLRPSSERPRLGWAAAALALSLGAGCTPPPLTEPDMGQDSIEDPGLDPQSLFEQQVKPVFKGYCSCHYTKQLTVDPFLATDAEYATITAFGGGRFLTNPPDISLGFLRQLRDDVRSHRLLRRRVLVLATLLRQRDALLHLRRDVIGHRLGVALRLLEQV